MINRLLWALLTKQCPYCGALLEYNEDLCADCRKNLPVINYPKCEYCGAGKDRCKCRKHKLRYDGMSSPFYYENGVKTCVRRLKFEGKDFAADILAKNMKLSVEKDFSGVDFDFITFVPFSSYQKRHREYNQCELLAERLSHYMNVPVMDILVKIYENSTQHQVKEVTRKGNVMGVYDVKKDFSVKGKTVLLVDDIKTTGATLNECVKILKIRGADKVYCTTAALTGKEKA